MSGSAFERRGGAPELTEIFGRFCKDKLSGVCLDEKHKGEHDRKTAPDYVCLNGLLVIEFKEIIADQSRRINDIVNARVDAENCPSFLGSVSLSAFLSRIENRDEITNEIRSKLRRTISAQLKKASKQISDYRNRYTRKNAVSVCAIFNSRVDVYEPNTIIHIVHNLMRTERFMEKIEAVIFISEKHFFMLPDGRPSFSIAVIENDLVDFPPWKSEVLSVVVERWSLYRTGSDPEVFSPVNIKFDNVEDVEDTMARSDFWRLSYRRKPYLRDFDLHAMTVLFMMVNIELMMAMLIGDWEKPSKEDTIKYMRLFTDLNEELNYRGLTVEEYSHLNLQPNERRKFIRPGIPQTIVDFVCPPDLSDE